MLGGATESLLKRDTFNCNVKTSRLFKHNRSAVGKGMSTTCGDYCSDISLRVWSAVFVTKNWDTSLPLSQSQGLVGGFFLIA